MPSEASELSPSFRDPSKTLPGRIHTLALLITLISTIALLFLSAHPSFHYLNWIPILALHIVTFCFSYIVAEVLFHSNPRYQANFRHRQNQWMLAFSGAALIYTAIAFKLPLRVTFLTIKPALEYAISTPTAATNGIPKDIIGPFHRISAANTNARLEWNRRDNINNNRILFVLSDDSESAFIYSPSGLENLSYNSGACGHLIGPWYWMTED